MAVIITWMWGSGSKIRIHVITEGSCYTISHSYFPIHILMKSLMTHMTFCKMTPKGLLKIHPKIFYSQKKEKKTKEHEESALAFFGSL